MTRLNDQPYDARQADARRQNRADWRTKIFGVSRRDAWDVLAREINARREAGGWWQGDRVVADVGPWVVTLDTYAQSNGETSTTYTRMRAPFVAADKFTFRIYRKSIFTHLGKMLGMQDIEIGEPFFDDEFVIQSNDIARVRLLMANPRLRQLIASQPRIRFGVRDNEGWFGKKFPHYVDELYFENCGVIKDVDRLKKLFDLFTETLHQLCQIKAARVAPAGVRV